MKTLGAIPFLILFILLLAGSVYLIIKIFTTIFPKLQKHFYKIFFVYYWLVLLFFVWMIWGYFVESIILQTLYTIWAFALWSVLINLLIFIPSFFIHKFFRNKFKKIFDLIFLLTFWWMTLFTIYSWFIPKITNYNIAFQEQHNFHWKKFVLIADTHYGYLHGERMANLLVNEINKINPEFVLIAWDFFDWPKIDYQKITNVFNKVNAPIFYANGNHEEYANTEAIIKAIENSKIQILNNKKIDFNWIEIAGVTYHDNKDESNLETMLNKLKPDNNKPSILIKHEPKGHSISEKVGFDLVVSWHTHKWQMFPVSLIPDIIYGKYVYGLVKDNTQYAITTSWVGNWWPPQRLWSQSEIVVVNID